MLVSAFYIAVMFLLVIPGIKILPKGVTESLSVSDSTKIKGILCVMVMFHHFSGWFVDQNIIIYTFSHIGSFIVGMFFFLSGYGLSKSDLKKKPGFKLYIKRFLRIILPYWICEIVYLIVHFVFNVGLDAEVNGVNLIKSVFTIGEIVSFSWYVTATLAVYLIYYLSLKFVKRKYLPIVIIAVMIVTFAFVPDLWVTYFAFPLGMIISEKEDRFIGKDKNTLKSGIIALLSIVIVAASCVFKILSQNYGQQMLMNICDSMGAVAFSLLVYILLTKIKVGNAVTAFFGKMSYEFYLLHGISILLANQIFGIDKPFFFIITAFAISTLLSFLVSKLTDMLIKPIFNKLL